MSAHAERHFALSAPADKDGKVSYRETLEGLLSRSRRPDNIAYYESELACPPLPPAMFYLWQIFNRIRRRIGSSGFGANPITLGDIVDFIRLFRYPLAPWEIEIIEMLDDLYMVQQAKSQRGDSTTDKD